MSPKHDKPAHISALIKRAEEACHTNDSTALEGCIAQGLSLRHIKDSPDLVPAILSTGSIAIYKVLLSHGWNINCGVGSRNALNLACKSNNVDLVRYLLWEGADPNKCGIHEHEVLVEKILHDSPRDFEILRILLMASRFRHETDETGAVLAAVEFADIDVLRLLVEYGADVNSDSDWSWEIRGCQTPLYAAAKTGDLGKALYLLDNGANPLWEDSTGRTCEKVAQEEGCSKVLRVFDSMYI